MQLNGFKKGLLFTSDPYSKIIDKNDKNTFLLFGDAATVTLISDNPLFVTGKFSFGTIGKQFDELCCQDKFLYMNGRSVFDFSAKYIPQDVSAVLKRNNMTLDDIDRFVFHQGSKFIVDTISKSLKLNKDKVSFDMNCYGNTVSSSIPLILEKEMKDNNNINLLTSGFGVGLSWASTILKRKD
jgi:3-oxoacyl-[acyl-carrier-protein] synthase-3